MFVGRHHRYRSHMRFFFQDLLDIDIVNTLAGNGVRSRGAPEPISASLCWTAGYFMQFILCVQHRPGTRILLPGKR